jgi:pimeloyl-ACP methyl ester carboxylesterase
MGNLVLVDSAGFVEGEGKKKVIGRVARFFRPLFKPAFMKSTRKGIYRLLGAEDYVETPELTETFKLVVSEDLSSFLPRITCPTLIIWGSEDRDTPVSFGKKMNELITDSKLVILEGAGHYSFLDKHDEFVVAAKDFYEKV